MKHTIAALIKFGGGQLHYLRIGNGPKAMLCFHGYGQNNTYFNSLSEALSDYTLYSFDLFFHGQSHWEKGEKPLAKPEWQQIIQQFLQKEQLNNISVCGYSMGAKFAMACLEAFPEKVEKIILIAPDGIKTHLWYSLATYPRILRRFFKWQILNPSLFFTLAKWMQKLGMIDKGIIKFAKSQMNTLESRSRVYHSWVVFRKLSFNLKHLSETINVNQIKLEMYLGKHDKIVTKKNMKLFTKHLQSYHLEIIDSGHTALISATAKHLLKENP